jgi:CRP-like cAMP-binding protein
MGRMRAAMAEGERQVVEDLIEGEETVESGERLATRGAECNSSTMLIEGFAQRVIERGSAQHIVGLHVAGDFIDLHGFALKRLDHDIMALGSVRVGKVPHVRLREVLEEQPHLARLLWFSTLLDAAIHREWILMLEDLNAAQRAAHVFCETWARLDMVGLGGNDGYAIPLAQAQLAGICGTTPVHMSRALRRLREEGLATFRHGKFHCPDRKALEGFCAFDRSYLYGAGDLHIETADYQD